MPIPTTEERCPAPEQYRQAAGAEKEALLRHLEGCDACARGLAAQPEMDTLADLLRQTTPEGLPRPDLDGLIERLCRLRPDSLPGVAPPKDHGKLGATGDLPPVPAADRHYVDFLAPPQAADELGRLGPYRVLRVLGSGGMGIVFAAEDPQLLRPVALKAMQPTLAAAEGARQRFLREARAAAAIRHDHVVSIYQVGEDRGVPYLAMEYLEGEPLDARLQRQGKLPAAEVLRVGREVALGLAAAHKRGLIHRDIKPANLWLEAETRRVKILDFGLARAAGAAEQLTQLGAAVGTPGFMAPEQANGKPVDQRCDLFSLGCVLYRMATGQAAFRGSDLVSTLMAVNTEQPLPPHRLDVAVPPALSKLIMDLLAKEPERRPASAAAVADALERIAREQVAPRPAEKPPVRRKGPLLAGVGVGILLLGLVGLWAGGVLEVKSRHGTIVLEDLPPDVQVLVDGDLVRIEGPDPGKPVEVRVLPGKRRLEIKTAGITLQTEDVSLAAGEHKPIHIHLVPLPPAGAGTPGDDGSRAGEERDDNALKLKLCWCPAGTFRMGSPAGEVEHVHNEGPVDVTLSRGFWMGKTEVTQSQWRKVMGTSLREQKRKGGSGEIRGEGPDHPMYFVTYTEATEFCRKLSASERAAGRLPAGWEYRLPTEAQWEYACRAGTTTATVFGDRIGSDRANFAGDRPYNGASPGPNHRATVPVGSYRPNAWGFLDMHGNVWEWCRDWYADSLAGGHDPEGPASGMVRSNRGGAWCNVGAGCRSAGRCGLGSELRYDFLGFRVARVPSK